MNATARTGKEEKLLRDHHVSLLMCHHASDCGVPELFGIDEVHLRAETMTPLLKGILEFRPQPHWS